MAGCRTAGGISSLAECLRGLVDLLLIAEAYRVALEGHWQASSIRRRSTVVKMLRRSTGAHRGQDEQACPTPELRGA
jgi:hypothetical protein